MFIELEEQEELENKELQSLLSHLKNALMRKTLFLHLRTLAKKFLSLSKS